MPTEELLLFISTFSTFKLKVFSFQRRHNSFFLMIKTFKFSIRCKIHIVCASFLEKIVIVTMIIDTIILLTGFRNKQTKPSSDDCGAPIQNTTAELLTISQLWSKTHIALNPNPWLIVLVCSCIHRLDSLFSFSVVVLVCVMKTISLLASETASLAVVLWSCKSIFRSDADLFSCWKRKTQKRLQYTNRIFVYPF